MLFVIYTPALAQIHSIVDFLQQYLRIEDSGEAQVKWRNGVDNGPSWPGGHWVYQPRVQKIHLV